jgi:hypothetical protein
VSLSNRASYRSLLWRGTLARQHASGAVRCQTLQVRARQPVERPRHMAEPIEVQLGIRQNNRVKQGDGERCASDLSLTSGMLQLNRTRR